MVTGSSLCSPGVRLLATLRRGTLESDRDLQEDHWWVNVLLETIPGLGAFMGVLLGIGLAVKVLSASGTSGSSHPCCR